MATNAGFTRSVDIGAGNAGFVVATLLPVPLRRTNANADNSEDQQIDIAHVTALLTVRCVHEMPSGLVMMNVFTF